MTEVPERKTTDAELAILSLLIEQPMHGYQIEQVIEERGMREWVEMGFSSIYYLLSKLKKNGLLESQLEKADGKGPTKQVFKITDTGREKWEMGLLDALAEPHRRFSNFELGIAYIDRLEQDEVIHSLKINLKMLKIRFKGVNDKYKSYNGTFSLGADLLFQHSLDQLECQIKSVESILQRLGDKDESN